MSGARAPGRSFEPRFADRARPRSDQGGRLVHVRNSTVWASRVSHLVESDRPVFSHFVCLTVLTLTVLLPSPLCPSLCKRLSCTS